MESDESIDAVNSKAVIAYRSDVAEEERKNPCEHSQVGENIDPPSFYLYFDHPSRLRSLS